MIETTQAKGCAALEVVQPCRSSQDNYCKRSVLTHTVMNSTAPSTVRSIDHYACEFKSITYKARIRLHAGLLEVPRATSILFPVMARCARSSSADGHVCHVSLVLPVSSPFIQAGYAASTETTGALHWATPETISKFGPEDSDEDSAAFTDDGA